MPHFFLKLIAPRSTFAMDMTADEKALMQTHAGYWMDLVKQGRVVVFGPVFDPRGAFGMGVVETADEAAAKALSAGDPVIQAGHGFSYEIHQMQAHTPSSCA